MSGWRGVAVVRRSDVNPPEYAGHKPARREEKTANNTPHDERTTAHKVGTVDQSRVGEALYEFYIMHEFSFCEKRQA